VPHAVILLLSFINMANVSEENTTSFFTKFAQHKISAHNGNHAQWVLFRHGSLYIQTMQNNVETPENELIQLAKASLAEVQIVPGSSFGDSTIYSTDFEGDTVYYNTIDTFRGIIIVHPANGITHDVMAMMHARANVLNDKKDPIVVATGTSKQN